MGKAQHKTLSAKTGEPCRLDGPRSTPATAMRLQIAAAAGQMPPEVEGRDGKPCAPQQAVAALLSWAGDDPTKLRRALRRAIELGAPVAPDGHAPPAGPLRVAEPKAPRRWRPKASAWDPDPSKRR